MDPLTVAASVGSLLAATTTVVRALNDLRGHFSRAEVTITAISTECTIITTTLTQISNLAQQDPAGFATRLQVRDGSQQTRLDVQMHNAIECCDVTIVALNDLLKKCKPKKEKGIMAIRQKAAFFFNESELKDRLQTMRGLNQALVGLVTAMQANSVVVMRQILDENTVALQTMTRTSKTLRKTYQASIINGTDSNFDFDDQVINSQAYRRAFHSFSKDKDTGQKEPASEAPFSQVPNKRDIDLAGDTLYSPSILSQPEQGTATDFSKPQNDSQSNQLPLRSKSAAPGIPNKPLVAKVAPILDEEKQAEVDNLLRLAAQGGNVQLVKTFLGQGAKANSADDSGLTSLHLAAKHGHVGCISILLQHGADVEAQCTDKSSRPLHLACSSGKGKSQVIATLISEGRADIEAQNSVDNHPLHLACIFGDDAMVRVLVEAGAAIESIGYTGWHPLHSAAANLQFSIVSYLLEKGADVDARAKNSDTPLRCAAKYEARTVAELLLDKGADIEASNDFGGTPLGQAAAFNRPAMIEFLLERGAKLEKTSNDGSTPLHWAVFKNSKDAAKVLLDRGTNIEARINSGRTPLIVATYSKSTACIELLLSRGAQINGRQTANGWTALHWAANDGLPEMAKILLQHGADKEALAENKERPIHRAAFKGSVDMIKLLLDEGAELESVGSESRTALHMAVSSQFDSAVKELLERGANVQAVGQDGWSVIHYAAAFGPVNTLNLVLGAGADLNSSEGEGNKPVHIAAMKGPMANVKRLLEAGASVDTLGKTNWQPMHFAAGNGKLETLNFLLEKGADAEASSEFKSTPLHLAAMWDYLPCLQRLLQHGVGINPTANNGKTPLHNACEKGHDKIVAELIKVGADKTIKDNTGKTAMELAVVNGHAKVVEVWYS